MNHSLPMHFYRSWGFALLLCFCASAVLLPRTVAAAEPQRWTETSKNGLYTISLEPRDGRVKINALQSWVATVLDPQGRPVNPARVLLDGGMRAHGHGLPTRPEIDTYLGDGKYLIEGLRLNMVGAWTVLVGVEQNGRRDVATFELEIDY